MTKSECSVKISLGLLTRLVMTEFDGEAFRVYCSVSDSKEAYFWSDNTDEFGSYDLESSEFYATSKRFMSVVNKAKAIIHEKEKEKASRISEQQQQSDADAYVE